MLNCKTSYFFQAQSEEDELANDDVTVSMEGSKLDEFFQDVSIAITVWRGQTFHALEYKWQGNFVYDSSKGVIFTMDKKKYLQFYTKNPNWQKHPLFVKNTVTILMLVVEVAATLKEQSFKISMYLDIHA